MELSGTAKLQARTMRFVRRPWIEQVWRKTRREATHNRYFKNKAELESKLDTYYGKFRAPNQELSSLCSFNYESQKAA